MRLTTGRAELCGGGIAVVRPVFPPSMLVFVGLTLGSWTGVTLLS